MSRPYLTLPRLPVWCLLSRVTLRDHLIHAYDTVDLDEVWKTATRDVPELLAAIEPLLPKKSLE
jgi:uncharacterized protein with HEPN domain